MAGLNDIAKEVGLSPMKVDGGGTVDVLPLLEEVFQAIVERCAKKESVRIKGFGTFEARLVKGRKVKSPLIEGGEAVFGDMLLLKFKQSGQSKKVLNADKRVEDWGGTYIEKPPRPSDIRRQEEKKKKEKKSDSVDETESPAKTKETKVSSKKKGSSKKAPKKKGSSKKAPKKKKGSSKPKKIPPKPEAE